MATRLLSVGGTGKPFSPNRLAIAAGRIFTILLALYLIHVTRQHNRIDAGLLLSLAVFVGLYFVFGRKGETKGPVLYLIATGAFTQLRLFGDQTGLPIHYSYPVRIDTTVFGVLPNHWLQAHLYTPHVASPVALYAAAIYMSYFVVFEATAFCIWVKARAFFAPYASAIVIAAFIGVIGCYTLPTAPPWMAARDGHAPQVHRVIEELASKVNSSAYNDGTQVAGDNQVAAMPSIHMALTVLVMLTVWRFTRNRFLRGLGLLYAASMSFALLFLGEHYVTDEFVGVLTALVAWNCAIRLWSPDGRRLIMPSLPWKKRPEAYATAQSQV